MRRRTFEEMITYFNQTVSEMDIDRKYKMTLLGIVTALLQKHDEELAKNSPKVNSNSGELISRQAAYETLTEYYHHTAEIQHKALREALERVPSAQPEPCEDTISRKEAIEAFDNLEWFHQNANKDMVSGANPEHHQAWYKEQDVYKTLEQLPSVKLFAVLQRACKHRCLSMDRYGGDSELQPTCHHEIYADVSWGECVEGKCPLLNPHKEERRTDESD